MNERHFITITHWWCSTEAELAAHLHHEDVSLWE